MSTKFKIKGSEKMIELPRGASVPRSEDIVSLILKGEKREKLYSVYLIEHSYNMNQLLPVGTCIVTLEELKKQKKSKEEE